MNSKLKKEIAKYAFLKTAKILHQKKNHSNLFRVFDVIDGLDFETEIKKYNFILYKNNDNAVMYRKITDKLKITATYSKLNRTFAVGLELIR